MEGTFEGGFNPNEILKSIRQQQFNSSDQNFVDEEDPNFFQNVVYRDITEQFTLQSNKDKNKNIENNNFHEYSF